MATVVLREDFFAYVKLSWNEFENDVMNWNEFGNDVINSSQLIYINIYLRDCKANTSIGTR